jgi:hypothetical protein
VVRVCALGTEKGKTRGFREALFSATSGTQLFSLDPPGSDDRPARLSTRALEAISRGGTILYSALAELFRDGGDLGDVGKRRVAIAVDEFRSTVTHRSVETVFGLLGRKEDLTEEQRCFDQLVTEAMVASFELASTALVDALAIARASLRLSSGIRFELRGTEMRATKSTPALARQVFAILEDIAAHLTPDDRARLRTMSRAQPPLTFWKHIAAVPDEQSDDPACVEHLGRAGSYGVVPEALW